MSKSVSWHNKALNLIASSLHEDHTRVTGEDIRFWLRSKRIRNPSSPNAYGALIRSAIDNGILRRLSRYQASVSPSSHGRKRRVYSVVKPRRASVG